MTHSRLWISAGIIALAIFVIFIFSVPHTRDISQEEVGDNAPVVPIVMLRDSFKKGTHTITGSIGAPNACTTVSAHPRIDTNASGTENIFVEISMVADEGVCLQLPTPMSFSTTVVAPEELPVIVTVQGVEASTTPL